MLLQELQKALAREPSDVQGFFNTDNWLRALRQSRDLDQDPLFPPPSGVPHTPSLVSSVQSCCPSVSSDSLAQSQVVYRAPWGSFATTRVLGSHIMCKLGVDVMPLPVCRRLCQTPTVLSGDPWDRSTSSSQAPFARYDVLTQCKVSEHQCWLMPVSLLLRRVCQKPKPVRPIRQMALHPALRQLGQPARRPRRPAHPPRLPSRSRMPAPS